MKATPLIQKRSKRMEERSFSLSVAKTYLGRLLQKAADGETIFITRGRDKFLIQRMPEIDPIPLRPAGYFAESYTSEDIKELNHTAKYSVVKAPKDLE